MTMSDESLILSSYANRQPAKTKEEIIAEYREGLYSDEVKPEQKQQEQKSFVEQVASAWETKNDTLKEIPGQVVGGALEATQELGNTALDLADWVENKAAKYGYGSGQMIPDDFRLSFADDLIPRGKTVGGNLARGVTQFLLPFAGAMKAVKIGANAGKFAKLAKGMVAGAAVDFAAFDPREERLSDLVQKHPDLANPITAYLASDKNDTEMEGRFKQTLEGMGLGGLTEGLFLAAKGYKALRAAKAGATEGAEAAAKTADPDMAKAIPTPPEFKGKKFMEFEPGQWKDTKAADRVFNINLTHLRTEDDIKKAMTALSENETIKAEVNAARGGIVKDAELLSKELGVSVEDVLTGGGKAPSHEKIIAMRRFFAMSGENLVEKAKLASGPEATDASRAEFLQSMNAYRAIQMRLAGATAEAGRTLRALGLDVGGSAKARERMIKEIMQLHGGSGNVGKMAGQLAEAAANGAKLVDVIMPGRWERLSDGVTSVYINGLLSTPSTHVANFMSNSTTVGAALAERALGTQLSRFHGGDKIVAGETGAMIEGLWSVLTDTFRLGAYAVKTRNVEAIKNKASDLFFTNNLTGWFNKAEFGAAETVADTTTTFGKAMEVGAHAINIPSKFLGTSDDFFKTLNYRMQVRALAVRDAAQKRLEGKAAREYVQKMVQSPGEEIHFAAVDFARNQTFTTPLEGRGKDIDQFVRKTPLLRVVSPFVRTPLNLFEYALERNPLIAAASSKVRSEIMADGARRDMALAKLAFGGSTMAVVSGLAYNGLITGAGPADANARKLKESSGWRANSIKVGDTWYSYKRTDPFGMVLGMAADFAELAGTLQDKAPDDYEELAVAAMGIVASNLTPDFLTENVGELLEVTSGDQRTVKKFATRLAGQLAQPVYSGLLRAITKEIDPIKRDTEASPDGGSWEKIVNQVKARTPGFSSSLPPQLNLFGEEVHYDPGVGPDIVSPIAYSQQKNDPVIKEIARLQLASPILREETRPGEFDLRLTMPPRILSYKNATVELDPKEYHQFVKYAAGIGLGDGVPTLRDSLAELIRTPEYKSASDQVKRAKVFQKIQGKYRGAAVKKMLGSSESLQTKLIEYKKAEEQVLLEAGQ